MADFQTFTGNSTDTAANWIWRGRLPDGCVILEGRGGLGKSTLVTDLAARVTTTKAWPDGAKKGRPGGFWLMGHEDRKPVVEQRLKNAGADISKCFLSQKFVIASEYDEFERRIKRHNIKLIVLDPAISFLGVDTRSEDQVRWILEKIDRTCEEYGCCVIMIRHMRKDANDQDPMEDGGRGTGALRNWVRAVYRLILDPDDESRRLLMATKFNYAEFPNTLVFRNGDGAVNKLVWDKEPSRWDAFNLISRPKDAVKRVEGRECDQWMRDYFEENGYRVRAKQCLKDGAEEGYSSATIKRTRVKLGITSHKNAKWQGQWMWTHPLYNQDDDPGPQNQVAPGVVIPGVMP